MKVVILIAARFASSRFPGKPLVALIGDQSPRGFHIGASADRRAVLAGFD